MHPPCIPRDAQGVPKGVASVCRHGGLSLLISILSRNQLQSAQKMKKMQGWWLSIGFSSRASSRGLGFGVGGSLGSLAARAPSRASSRGAGFRAAFASRCLEGVSKKSTRVRFRRKSRPLLTPCRPPQRTRPAPRLASAAFYICVAVNRTAAVWGHVRATATTQGTTRLKCRRRGWCAELVFVVVRP